MVDELTTAMIRWQDTFEDHSREEMIRYKEILDEVKASRKLSINRSAALDEKIEAISSMLKEHSDEGKRRHELLTEQLHTAIPDKDFAGHGRMYIERKEDQTEKKAIALETKKKVVSGVTWGGITLIGYALIEYIKILAHKS
jgi:hypothetical protein